MQDLWLWPVAPRLSCSSANGILVPQPDSKPMTPALAGRFLTTGLPGKFPQTYFNIWGFLGGSVVKNPPANAGDTSSIPGSGRSSGGRNGNPLQYSCLENPWTEELGRLQFMGSQRVRHDWRDWADTHASRLMQRLLHSIHAGAQGWTLRAERQAVMIWWPLEYSKQFGLLGIILFACGEQLKELEQLSKLSLEHK